jgi:lysophospholipase L1-like esterase
MASVIYRRLGALAASLAIAALCAEVGLRLSFPADSRHYVWAPRRTIVWRLNPAWVHGLSRETRFTINSQGIRGPELGADEYRILAMGGSTTESLAQDDASAWPALVAGALPRSADGRKVWIGNVGKSGHYSRDHVLHLKYLSAELLRIDRVLLLVGVNDLMVALAQGDSYVMPPPITDAEAEQQQARRAFALAPGRLETPGTWELAAPGAPFYERTALFQLLVRARWAARNIKGASGLAQDERGEYIVRWRERRRHATRILTQSPDLAAPLAEYRRNLNVIADLAAARKIDLVLMTQPTLWRADLPEEAADLLWFGGVGDFQRQAVPYYSVAVLAETMRRFNEVLLDVCRERQLPCLDLAARIPPETTMLFDDCHYTDAGANAVAAAVVEHLRGLPPFSRGRATSDSSTGFVMAPAERLAPGSAPADRLPQ